MLLQIHWFKCIYWLEFINVILQAKYVMQGSNKMVLGNTIFKYELISTNWALVWTLGIKQCVFFHFCKVANGAIVEVHGGVKLA
jgi:hypothetical protein